jgi:alpha-L-fucosidase
MLLLNIPPDRHGLFHEVDVQRLREMGEYLRKTFGKNLAENARITADRDDGCHFAENVKEDTYDAFFKTKDGENTASITITLAEKEKVSHVVLKEHIPMSQRVERFAVEAKLDSGEWRTVAEGTTIGYKRVLRFEEVLTQRIRIRIQDSRVCPVISFIGVY